MKQVEIFTDSGGVPMKIILLLVCTGIAAILLLLRIQRRHRCTICVTAHFHQDEGLFPDTYWYYTYQEKTYHVPLIGKRSSDELELFIDPNAPEICYDFSDVRFWLLFLPPLIAACVIIYHL